MDTNSESPQIDISKSIPGIFPENAPHENKPGENQPEPKVGRIKRFVKATQGVLQNHGISFTKGRGRPRKDGQPGKLDKPIGEPGETIAVDFMAGGENPFEEVPISTGDVSTASLAARKTLKVCWGALWKGLKSFIRYKAGQAFPNEPKYADDLANQLEVSEPENEEIAELSEIVLRKYNVPIDNIPEVALAVAVGSIGAKFGLILSTLNAKITNDRKNQQTA